MIVPVQNGYKVNAAADDVCFAVANDDLDLKYQQSIDEFQASIDDSVSELPDELDEPENQASTSYDDNNSDTKEIVPKIWKMLETKLKHFGLLIVSIILAQSLHMIKALVLTISLMTMVTMKS